MVYQSILLKKQLADCSVTPWVLRYYLTLEHCQWIVHVLWRGGPDPTFVCSMRLVWGMWVQWFVVYLPHCEGHLSGLALLVNHRIDLLPTCQDIGVHACMLESAEGLRQGWTRKKSGGLLGWWLMVHITVHIMHCLKKKGRPKTPLHLLSLDIFVFQSLI